MARLKLLNCFSVYLDHSYQNSTGKHPHKLLDIYVKERSSWRPVFRVRLEEERNSTLLGVQVNSVIEKFLTYFSRLVLGAFH